MATGLPYLLETAFLFTSSSNFQRSQAVTAGNPGMSLIKLFLAKTPSVVGFSRIKKRKTPGSQEIPEVPQK
jgi:hypothetical protein